MTSRLVKYGPSIFQKWYKQGEAWSAAKLHRHSWIRRIAGGADPHRLVVSGAESCLLRKILLPISAPTKLLLAFTISGVVGSKSDADD